MTVTIHTTAGGTDSSSGCAASTNPVLMRDRAWGCFQRAMALFMLALASPLLVIVYVLVKSTSRGPFLYRQQRPGLNGKTITVYKVRTMTVGSERSTALGVRRVDPAITAVGKCLRDLKIDELPQLLNVIRGEMVFVGPRPIPIPLDKKLRQDISGFEKRYAVKPGLTSVSQTCVHDNLLEGRLAEDWSQRLEGELHYIRHRNLSYDLIVIGLTVLFIARRVLGMLWGAPPSAQHTTTDPRHGIEATLVAGVPIANLNYAGVISKISEWVSGPEGRMVGVCPVHSIVGSMFNSEHRHALCTSDLNTADGMPVVWTQRFLGFAGASRVYGPTLMLKTLAEAERRGWRVAFYGGHSDRLNKMLRRVAERFPGLDVVEAISPPFGTVSQSDDDEMTRRLVESKADLIWVGIGSPRQEIWMSRHRDRIPAVMIGVGAAFDFHAGAVPQAPAILQWIGMEWAYRLCREPRRLFWRYAKANPLFLVLLFRQLIQQYVFRIRFSVSMGCPSRATPNTPTQTTGSDPAVKRDSSLSECA